MRYELILFYKYVDLENPEEIKAEQIQKCKELGIKGRTIVASEGINATLEGKKQDIDQYISWMEEHDSFKGIHYKRSETDGGNFPKLSVKVRSELVTANLGEADINPNQITGKYITAEELYDLWKSGEEFYVVDMRNDYEHKVGYFENSILAPFENFSDLPKALEELAELKDKTVVTVCTGGIRCEKASGFLVKHGFKNVFQLYGGIQTFMGKYPNQYFLGKLYVFDGRVTWAVNEDVDQHTIVSKCEKCGDASDNYIDCAYMHCTSKHRHFICCEKCYSKDGKPYCSEECIEKSIALVAATQPSQT